ECEVTPHAVHGDAEQFRIVLLKLGQQLVVERDLVTAHRTPVGRIETEDQPVAAELVQRHRLIWGRVEREVWCFRARPQCRHTCLPTDWLRALSDSSHLSPARATVVDARIPLRDSGSPLATVVPETLGHRFRTDGHRPRPILRERDPHANATRTP